LNDIWIKALVLGAQAGGFWCCAFGMFGNSRVAACIGAFLIATLFATVAIPAADLPFYFIMAWLASSGVKGTVATSRLQKKSTET